MRFGLILGIPL